jgi:Na+-transporting NADH:ubiquinone oxidoreductase subunit NqrF
LFIIQKWLAVREKSRTKWVGGGFRGRWRTESDLSRHEDPTEIDYCLWSPVMMRAVEKMWDSLGMDPEMVAYDEF